MRSTLLCFAALFVADGALGFTAMPSASTLRSFQPSLRAVSGPRDHLVGRTALKMELEKIEMVNLKGHTATIYPFGAVVGSYKAPHEVFFIRPDAKMDGSKPISGGVPHCFPQFGPGEIQQHGFARNLVWRVATDMSSEKENPSVTMELVDNAETMAMWPNKFKASYRVGLDDDRLDCELTITNTDAKPWNFQAALHTYLATSDVNKAEVRGAFKGASFLNKMQTPPTTTKEERSVIKFEKETDSVYEGVAGEVVFYDGVKPEQSVTIRNLKGWEDTVLWSPYGNEGMGYKNFACVESVKAATPVTLAPGESWSSAVSFVPGAPKA